MAIQIDFPNPQEFDDLMKEMEKHQKHIRKIFAMTSDPIGSIRDGVYPIYEHQPTTAMCALKLLPYSGFRINHKATPGPQIQSASRMHRQGENCEDFKAYYPHLITMDLKTSSMNKNMTTDNWKKW